MPKDPYQYMAFIKNAESNEIIESKVIGINDTRISFDKLKPNTKYLISIIILNNLM